MPNGLSQRYKTLGELMTELKARLGFVAQGPASNNNNAVVLSFLQEGHDYVYSELDPAPARKKTVITLEPGSVLYDWHNDIEDEDIDPGTVISVWVADGEDWYPMTQGISPLLRSETHRSMPARYDTLNGQCEVWPTPDKSYQMGVEYIAPRPRFTHSSDRPGVPDRLILLYAIAQAKAHYRHSDAQAAGAIFTNMLRIEKGKQHENRRYIVNERSQAERTVTGSDGVYRFRTGG